MPNARRLPIEPRRAVLLPAACAVLLAATLVAGVASASAAEVCVECTGPDKVYVCQIEKSDKVASFNAGLQALQYVCAAEMSARGKHARCKARRSADNCLGVIETVSLEDARRSLADTMKPVLVPAVPSGTTGVSAAAGASGASGGAAEQVGVPPQAPGSRGEAAAGPPRTMKELAERTIDASGEQAKAAGDAVAGGVSKSWKCLTTLFQKC